MANSIKLIVHRGHTIFDSLIVTPFSVIRYEQKVRETKTRDQVNDNITTANKHIVKRLNQICLNERGYNSYVVSAYVATLIRSHTYREAALKKLLLHLVCKLPDTVSYDMVLLKLRTPKKQFLDYKWNERITRMAMEWREVDHAMSWLSTLGGAFSALGEEFEYCAEMAGKISAKQFQLALRLGDPLLVARCKLYAALSLIQRGQLRAPKKIIRSIYKFSLRHNDIRLQRMSQGIWAKLKYCFRMRKEQHRTIKN